MLGCDKQCVPPVPRLAGGIRELRVGKKLQPVFGTYLSAFNSLNPPLGRKLLPCTDRYKPQALLRALECLVIENQPIHPIKHIDFQLTCIN
jgi:hypothetical protein